MFKEFIFGKSSKRALKTCHADLQMIMRSAIAMTTVDFGVSEGYRSVERQKALFDLGKSKIDGITRKGKHNYDPSLACDIYAYLNGRSSYDKETLSYLAGMIEFIGKQLYVSKKITHLIRWGGNWDMDGEILLDQSFDDRPHFELIKPKYQ